MASLNLPAVEIPDNLIATSNINKRFNLGINLAATRPFRLYGEAAVNLDIKYLEKRYEVIGTRKGFSYNPCIGD